MCTNSLTIIQLERSVYVPGIPPNVTSGAPEPGTEAGLEIWGRGCGWAGTCGCVSGLPGSIAVSQISANSTIYHPTPLYADSSGGQKSSLHCSGFPVQKVCAELSSHLGALGENPRSSNLFSAESRSLRLEEWGSHFLAGLGSTSGDFT